VIKIIKSFDQLKKHNFDQLNFGQVIIPPYFIVDCQKLYLLSLLIKMNTTKKKKETPSKIRNLERNEKKNLRAFVNN
jgi:hypothetical protein